MCHGRGRWGRGGAVELCGAEEVGGCWEPRLLFAAGL